MIQMSGSQYQKKCDKVADAYASVVQAQEEFVNFLTAIGDIDLDIPDIGNQAEVVGKLLAQAKGSLETF